ncbi:energy transducer TonB [Rufibacter roseus]|uniref:Energy transducer TonB n=1 Tax=Rufibacter roseus TaxID=1567108 RepID=A0ABW2DJE8_9BACT|nr:energy transducer TonB [Rufibacter roseus]
MEMKTAYPATLQDIIFEGRNKAYGAYLLRKLYPRHIGQALLMAIAMFTLLFSLPILVGKLFGSDEVVVPKADPTTPIWYDYKELPVVQPEVTPPVEQPESGGKKVATIKDTTPKVVDDKKDVTDVIPDRSTVAQSTAGLATQDGDGPATIDNPALGDGTGTGTGIGDGDGAGTSTGTSNVEPFVVVEQMPEFNGGMAKLMDFVSKNIRYPGGAQRNGIEGTVVASFVIMPNGEVADITILKGLGYGTEEEAIRVLKKMPRWKPGVQNGRKVPVRMTLPIRLELK